MERKDPSFKNGSIIPLSLPKRKNVHTTESVKKSDGILGKEFCALAGMG